MAKNNEINFLVSSFLSQANQSDEFPIIGERSELTYYNGFFLLNYMNCSLEVTHTF